MTLRYGPRLLGVLILVLDQTFMFSIYSKNEKRKHEVKALEIIWAKFPQWAKHNTIHVDDLGKNFAMNPKNGLKIPPFKNAAETRSSDTTLKTLARYLSYIANIEDLSAVDHTRWALYTER